MEKILESVQNACNGSGEGDELGEQLETIDKLYAATNVFQQVLDAVKMDLKVKISKRSRRTTDSSVDKGDTNMKTVRKGLDSYLKSVKGIINKDTNLKEVNVQNGETHSNSANKQDKRDSPKGVKKNKSHEKLINNGNEKSHSDTEENEISDLKTDSQLTKGKSDTENQEAQMILLQELAEELCKENESSYTDDKKDETSSKNKEAITDDEDNVENDKDKSEESDPDREEETGNKLRVSTRIKKNVINTDNAGKDSDSSDQETKKRKKTRTSGKKDSQKSKKAAESDTSDENHQNNTRKTRGSKKTNKIDKSDKIKDSDSSDTDSDKTKDKKSSKLDSKQKQNVKKKSEKKKKDKTDETASDSTSENVRKDKKKSSAQKANPSSKKDKKEDEKESDGSSSSKDEESEDSIKKKHLKKKETIDPKSKKRQTRKLSLNRSKSKTPKKKGNESSDDDSDESSVDEDFAAKPVRASAKASQKATKKLNDESSSSDSEVTFRKKDESDEDSDDPKPKALPMPKIIDSQNEENIAAKQELIEDIKNELSDSSSTVDESDEEEKPAKTKKASSKPKKAELSSDSDFAPVKKKRFRSNLLNAKISDSDSDKSSKKKKKVEEEKSESEEESGSDEDKSKKKRKRVKRVRNSSDEDGKEKNGDEEEDDDEKASPTKGGRKKIRKVMSDKKVTDETKAAAKAEEERRQRVTELQKKFNIVTVEDANSPSKCPITTKLVLESDADGNPLVEVNKHLIKKLKPHQVEAIQFMWSCCIESLKRLKKDSGSGCILAHCMGLGKTLSVVSFVHTVLAAEEHTGMTTCLIVSPLNTVLNWRNECTMWLKEKDQLSVYELSSVKDNHSRARYLKEWIREGGVMIIGYEMYRNLTNTGRVRNKKLKKSFEETLVDPGPDLVVCDEGHILKNESSAISQAMNKIKTRRRVVLTGTPLQNNLNEYHCMVSFVKPKLLGTRKEFLNRFVNPITNGQCSDSTQHDVKVMKRRAHVLHEMLAGCVQRKDYSALTKFLPPKLEYVISVRLATLQMDLYEKYLEINGMVVGSIVGKGGRLFQDFQSLSKIWTHPWILKLSEIRQEAKMKFDDEEEEDDEEDLSDSFIDDSSTESSASSSSDKSESSKNSESEEETKGRKTRSKAKKKTERKKSNEKDNTASSSLKQEKVGDRDISNVKTRSGRLDNDENKSAMDVVDANAPISNEWWADFLKGEDESKLELSGKLTLLFEILRMCEEIGDKVLVFSQSLLSLDIIESFLDIIDRKWQEEAESKTEEEKVNVFGKSWTKGADYFRMDGSTSVNLRQSWAEHFNDPENYRARLFLISTKAGGLGINLVGANRAIIFDASWNPSHDIQSIFRVYRFGQVKPVYIYRFLAQGTMEEKIYERQVTKQSLSQRVVDEHQIERHFSANDLQELYAFRPDRLDDPNRVEKTPILPKDNLLAEMLKKQKDWIVSYHEHDSLLENKVDESLSEEERKSAWEEYEQDKNKQPVVNRGFPQGGNMMNMHYNQQMNSIQQRAYSADNVSQVVQLVRTKFPHLTGNMFQAQVQNIIMQQIIQYQQQQEQEIAIRQRQEMERLRLFQSQVADQQKRLNMASSSSSSFTK